LLSLVYFAQFAHPTIKSHVNSTCSILKLSEFHPTTSHESPEGE